MFPFLILISYVSFAQKTPFIRQRLYEDSTGKYIVDYVISGLNEFQSMKPTVGWGPNYTHWIADITVYRLMPYRCNMYIYDTIPIGMSFRGFYVAEGCFEDVPGNWVKKAKSFQNKDQLLITWPK